MSFRNGTTALLFALFASGLGAQTIQVSGTIRFAPKQTVPPPTLFTVTLEDVTATGKVPPILNSVRLRSQGMTAPYRFMIPIDKKKLLPNRKYQVKVTGHVEGKLAWRSQTPYKPGLKLDLTIPIQQPVPASEVFEGIDWRLSSSTSSEARTPVFLRMNSSNGQFQLKQGNQQLSGTYRADGQNVRFTPASASNPWANRLAQVDRATRSDGSLTLFSGGQVVMVFQLGNRFETRPVPVSGHADS